MLIFQNLFFTFKNKTNFCTFPEIYQLLPKQFRNSNLYKWFIFVTWLNVKCWRFRHSLDSKRLFLQGLKTHQKQKENIGWKSQLHSFHPFIKENSLLRVRVKDCFSCCFSRPTKFPVIILSEAPSNFSFQTHVAWTHHKRKTCCVFACWSIIIILQH